MELSNETEGEDDRLMRSAKKRAARCCIGCGEIRLSGVKRLARSEGDAGLGWDRLR